MTSVTDEARGFVSDISKHPASSGLVTLLNVRREQHCWVTQIVVLRDLASRRIFYVYRSGWSHQAIFSNVKSFTDLTELTPKTLDGFFYKVALTGYKRRKVEDFIKELKLK